MTMKFVCDGCKADDTMKYQWAEVTVLPPLGRGPFIPAKYDFCPECVKKIWPTMHIGPQSINERAVYGVARTADGQKALTVFFKKRLSDDQMRAFHNFIGDWKL